MNWIPPSVVLVALAQPANKVNTMHTYIGTKMVLATPMTRGEYNAYRQWVLPLNEEGTDEGYLVEYLDGPMNHDAHNGYISWSPKKKFDEAYTDLGYIEGRPPHQQRVIGEHGQLAVKCAALHDFLDTPFFLSLPFDEQRRLRLQYVAMNSYLTILNQRIEAFQ